MENKRKPPSNPHDIFFNALFRYREVAIELVRNFLPEAITSKIDFDHFEIDPNTYLSEDLKQQFSDMVYRTRLSTGIPLRVAILFEHKSNIPAKDYPVQIQLLNYQTGVWRTDREQKRKPTFVMPIVLYHGPQKWKKEPFWDIFKGLPKAWRTLAPSVPYHLIDLQDFSDENLIEKGNETFLGSGLLCFKHSHDPQFFGLYFSKLINFVWTQWPPNQVIGFMVHFVQYVENISHLSMKEIRKETRMEAIERLLANPRPSFVVEAEEEGRKKGREEGKKEGRLEGIEEKTSLVVKNILKEMPNLSDERIAMIASADKELVKRLRKEHIEKENNSTSDKDQ